MSYGRKNFWWVLCIQVLAVLAMGQAIADPTPEQINEAMRRTGLSRQEVLRLYAEQSPETSTRNQEPGSSPDNLPGRSSLAGIDDSSAGNTAAGANATEFDPTAAPTIILPGESSLMNDDLLDGSEPDSLLVQDEGPPIFGLNFFRLDEGLFKPPSFGPVPADYHLGVGDEVVVDVWGGVEFRMTRLVDRDGSIILPRGGKIPCVDRTLEQVASDIRSKLGRFHSSIDEDGPDGQADGGDTFVEVSLGTLRGIRVFVIGEVVRPGSYQVSSLSTILGALYAAGGPAESGSLREVRLVRNGQDVGQLDLYAYLLDGHREGDRRLREGDTILVPGRGNTVLIEGEVRRPYYFEILPAEGLHDLFRYAGGFTALAAPAMIHIQQVVPVNERRAGQPDLVLLDVPFDAQKMVTLAGKAPRLTDGSMVQVGAISDRLENWVEVTGMVKNPGVYEFTPGMRVADLVSRAGGLWPDALTERASIDRTGREHQLLSVSLDLQGELAGTNEPVLLQGMDVLEIFSRWDVQERPQVHISGEVFQSTSLDFREGLTLRDLVLKAGGLKPGADLFRAEINRLKLDAVHSTDLVNRPNQTTEAIQVELGKDFLLAETSVALQPHDRVAIHKMPWWELQRTVTVSGEVFYPGVFSLERQDETISSVLRRAGGLKPDAYLIGARLVRSMDGVGNIALDLTRALAEPGSQYDIVLQNGDQILIPDTMHTVKVVGEVGFPTSLIFESDKDIDYYVNRAGGYLEQADKKKARVVWPNGMSLPNKGGSQVVAGSTIIVPVKPPQEGKSKMETMTEITAILAGLATVWLVIDNTSR